MVLKHYNEDERLLKVVLWDNTNYFSFNSNVCVKSNNMSTASDEGPSVEVNLHCRRTRERNGKLCQLGPNNPRAGVGKGRRLSSGPMT